MLALAAAPGAINSAHLVIALAVGLGCSALVFLTARSVLNQGGALDPFIYAAYIHDYPATLARFGRTYYSTRIAYIYPARALTHLFGLVAGYYIFQILALGVAAASVFVIGLRYFGYRVAFLAAFWLCFTPWLPRELAWTYVDGTAVTYLLLASVFLLVPVKKRLLTYAAAGSAFALAVNCYALVLAVGAFLALGFLLVYKRQSQLPLIFAVLAALAGFCLTYLALALALYVEFPEHGFLFEERTFHIAKELLAGQAANWYVPLSVVFIQMKYFALFIPVTLFVTALALWPGGKTKDRIDVDRVDFARVSIPYLGGVIALALVFHFVIHSEWLSQPSNVIYFLPPSTLVFLFICGQAECRGGRVYGSLALAGGGALIFVLWLMHREIADAVVLSNLYFWIGLAIAMAAAALLLRRARFAALPLIACAAFFPLSFYEFHSQGRHYDDMTARNPALEWDLYRGAIFLQEFVNGHLDPEQGVGFWYSNGVRQFNSIQSTFLWLYTRLAPPTATNPGMPVVDQAFVEAASKRHFVVLLGLTMDEIDSALAALRAAGFSYHDLQRTHFQGQVWSYSAALISLTPPQRSVGSLVFTVQLSELHVAGGASASATAGGLRLITASPQWFYLSLIHI